MLAYITATSESGNVTLIVFIELSSGCKLHVYSLYPQANTVAIFD